MSVIASSVSPVQDSVRLRTAALEAVLATTLVIRSSVSRVKLWTMPLPKVRLLTPL